MLKLYYLFFGAALGSGEMESVVSFVRCLSRKPGVLCLTLTMKNTSMHPGFSRLPPLTPSMLTALALPLCTVKTQPAEAGEPVTPAGNRSLAVPEPGGDAAPGRSAAACGETVRTGGGF